MANGQALETTGGKKIFLYRYATPNAELSSTQYLSPSVMRFSQDSVQPTISSTQLTNEIPIQDGVVNDDGSNTFTGSNAGSNSTDNTTRYKEGAGVTDNTAQNLIKDDTSVTATWAISDLSSAGIVIDSSKYIGLWIYFSSSAFTTLATTNAVVIKFGSDASNYYSVSYDVSDLNEGWNWISSNKTLVSALTETGTVGTPIDYFEIEITTQNATDEFVAGDVVYDLLRTWDTDDLNIGFVDGYPSVDFTNLEITERARVNSLLGNGFLIDAKATYNTDTNPIMASAASFSDKSKSSTDEFVFITKKRVI